MRPGNEYGERIHNFFGQEGLSQDQNQSQVAAGNWSGFSNGVVGNQRQLDPSLLANQKSFSLQQSVDPARGQSSNLQYGSNFTQQHMRSDYSRNLLQEQHQFTNGYMHGQAVPTRAEDKLSSARGFTPDMHNNTSPMRFEMGESPVKYDFFGGGQQQLNSQPLPGMLQPFPRQQMTFNDMQLLKQQVMFKQMHEYQMQQLEARQLNSLNSNPVNGSRSSDNQSHPLMINGIPLQDGSSNGWQPDPMTGNTNWMHHQGMSPSVQGSSSGLMITPQHGQGNIMAQQFQPSSYGMSAGGANTPQNAFSSIQMNGLAANKISPLTNQPTSFLNQAGVQNSNMLPSSTSTYQEKPLFSHTSGSNNKRNSFGSLQQDDSRERIFGQMEGSGPSEESNMNVPENTTALQKSTALDPTEEKILFGSDDNLWEAFGNSTDMSMTGNLMSGSSDLFDACPSLQSGRWSALMQSAVAETSNEDTGVGFKASNALSESTQPAVQHVEKSVPGIVGHNNMSSVQKNEGSEDSFGIWKAAANPNPPAALFEQKNHFTQNLQMQKAANYGFGIGSDSRDSNSVEKTIPQLNSRDGSQILESYANNNAVKVMAESNKTGNTGKENSNESFRSKLPQQSFTPDFSALSGGKETQSGHVSNGPSMSRKFQYHPMGNIGVTDEPYREKVSHLQPTNQGYFGQSMSFGQPATNRRINKGHVPQNDLNCKNEGFKGMASENSPNTSASADRSADRRDQAKSASSRQTMLELLHKVDQPEEPLSETNVSGIPEAKMSAQYGGQFRHHQPSASHGFSLQLAPPSQAAAVSSENVQSLNSLPTAPDNGGSRFAPWASNPSFPQQPAYKGPFPGISGEGNIISSFPYSRGYHQNQLMPTQQSASNHLAGLSSELSTSQVNTRGELSDFDQRSHSQLNPTTHNDARDSGFPMLLASQPVVVSSSPQQSSSSGMMSAPQHRFWNQSSKAQPDILRPHPLPSNSIEGSFSRQDKANQLSSHNGGDVSLSGKDMANMHEFQSKDMGVKQISDAPSKFSKMAQSNLQTVDHSLPSNNVPKDNFHRHEQTAGSGEAEAPKMIVKRVEDSAIDPQTIASRVKQQSPSRSDGLVRDELSHKELPNHIVDSGQTIFQGFPTAGADHQQISPQMAPSWYSQYGTFKNGLVQPVIYPGRATSLKIREQSSNAGSSDSTHSAQLSKEFNVQQMSGSAPSVQLPSSDLLPQSATDKLLKVDDKPKKRKTETSELLSWNKEVMQSPQRLKTLSEAEVDWSRATNRFAQKVEFETSLEDRPPVRSKRRLIYTTQLMQQLCPPPGKAVSLVTSSNYESIVYNAARAALGDACSSTSTDKSDHLLPPNDSNLLSEKISDQHIFKAAKDFSSRTQKLETDFTGLENGTTIADLRVEVQELEKFAVINRFARFHPASTSMDRSSSSLKLNPQRYVSIAPMPQNIPDRVQCLSL